MNHPRTDFCYSNLATGMAGAVFAEIAGHLRSLAEQGEESVIDLRSLPLTDADLAELDQRLGTGEVRVEIDVIGNTEVRETAYAGVWWVRHMGADGRVAAEEIVVARVPDIVSSQPEDIALALENIRGKIEAEEHATSEREAIHG